MSILLSVLAVEARGYVTQVVLESEILLSYFQNTGITDTGTPIFCTGATFDNRV